MSDHDGTLMWFNVITLDLNLLFNIQCLIEKYFIQKQN